jgi:hypothetical protein
MACMSDNRVSDAAAELPFNLVRTATGREPLGLASGPANYGNYRERTDNAPRREHPRPVLVLGLRRCLRRRSIPLLYSS